MKKKQATALLVTLALCTALTGCEMSGYLPLDGDDMLNPNPISQQTPDPIKDPVKDGTGENTDKDNTGDEGNENGKEQETSKADNEAVFEAFINNETKAKFDNIIDGENTYYTFSEMVSAEAKYLSKAYSVSETEPKYTVERYYSYIDCGADDVKDLGIRLDYTIEVGEDYYQTMMEHFIFMVVEDELKCITVTEDYYRTRGGFNEYGFITEGGSGGAALYLEIFRFVNSKGENVFDYYSSHHMGQSEPGVYAYDLPSDLIGLAPIMEYSSPGYMSHTFNLEKYPEYPTNLNWDEATSQYDAKSQELMKKYDEEYAAWVGKNFFSCSDDEYNNADPTGVQKEFIEENKITYYSYDKAMEIISEHEKEIGLTDKIKNGGYPKWISLDGQGTAYNESVESLYIGEYMDENGDPNLQIARGSDGTYKVQIGIYRLCFLDDGVGELYDDRMDFGISDDNGGHMEGNIVVDESGKATVTFTYSEWDYIKNGDVYEYKKSSDTPNIFEPMY